MPKKDQEIQEKAQEIKKTLLQYVKDGDFDGIKSYVEQHSEEIFKIFAAQGSGAHFISAPYETICFTDPILALKYQNLLEKEIAGDVLFADE